MVPKVAVITISEDHSYSSSSSDLDILRLLKKFKTGIVYADKMCDICMRWCYPSKIEKLKIRSLCDEKKELLPLSLIMKNCLQLCPRCFQSTQKSGGKLPSTAYWKNLNRGIIPDELASLTGDEKFLVSRIVPFLKIDSRKFGQYGFNSVGIKDQLMQALTLPRRIEGTGAMQVVKDMANIEGLGELTIDRYRVNTAVKWLNNPPDKDLRNNSPQASSEDETPTTPSPEEVEVEEVETVEVQFEFERSNYWKKVYLSCEMLQGNFSLESDIFGSSRGKQCTAAAVSAVAKAKVVSHPSTWRKTDLDSILFEADNLHEHIRQNLLRLDLLIPRSGYLWIRNLAVIKENLEIFQHRVDLIIDENQPLVEGQIEDDYDVEFPSLSEGLETLFKNHDFGLLLCKNHTLTVMKFGDYYYVFDPNSTGPDGAPARKRNLKSSLFEIGDFEQFHGICKRNLMAKSEDIYTLWPIDVLLRLTENKKPYLPGNRM